MELLLKGRVLSCGMDETQQDLYEERLKEVFRSFDASGVGSLSPEELVELCQALQLQEAAPTLLHGLLQEQDSLTGRVDFEQFKNALILVLSSSSSSSSTSEPQENQETSARPGSPEVHPKFVKGGKRYGRRSTPEFIESVTDFTATIAEKEGEVEEGYSEDSAVPRKRERWNSHDSSTEEYEAEGQLHLWNPDEPGTPRGTRMPLRERVEERLHAACTDLALPWDAPVTKQQLLLLCQHADMEVTEEQWQWVDEQGEMSVSEFTVLFSRSQPPTPSSSTPYRQLKRHHSTQPFDESGRRISVVTSTLGLRLFSALDDGTGHTPAEYLLDAWIDEGIDNSPEILQALDFSLEGKVNLSELTLALENELLMTKNGIHQAALASFKAEIRHLLERVDRELREKDKIRSDLEKAEKLKSQLASEVDEHHSAIERLNDINLRKLKQDHKERFSALRLELTQEMDRLQQQANQQREELEAEVKKAREDETFLRERLALTAKENGRLEAELLDSTEKLVEAENQASKLQESLDNVLKEKFGDLDPDSSEFFLQEDRLCRLRRNYEEQCRELQDRIDELQAELEEYRVVGRMAPPPSVPSLSEELNSKSPGIESDQGLGSEEGQPFNMSLEAEMLLEQAKEHHLKDIETVQSQQLLEEQKAAQEEMRTELSSQHQEELQPLREELSQALSRAQKLQIQLDQLVEERVNFEIQTEEHRTLNKKHEEEVSAIIQELHESQGQAADLEEQLKALKVQHAEMEEMERQHAEKINRLQQKQDESVQSRLEEQRERLQTMIESEKRLREEWKQDRRHMEQSHEEVLHTRLEKVKVQFEEQRLELERRLNEQLEQKRSQLEERHKEILDALLVEEGLRVLKDHEEKEAKLREQWEEERALLEQQCEATLQNRLAEEQETLHILEEEIERKLVDEFKKQRAQLEEQHRATLEERLQEEREKLQSDKLEMERRWKEVLIEEKWCLEESHREVVQDLTSKHSEERERLSSLLEKLREDIAEERRELECLFSQRIKEVEDRFSSDQDSISERFQADIQSVEQHYQSKLQSISDHHNMEKAKWESEVEAASQEANEQCLFLQERLEEEKALVQELSKEREWLESAHKEEINSLKAKNQELQNELESFTNAAQTKEIELIRQLNELHDRLQENLDAKDELVTKSEKAAKEMSMLLQQAANDFEQERAELKASLSDLNERQNALLSLADQQMEEKRGLLEERERLSAKAQEMEQLLHQAVEDFKNERLEMQFSIAELEEKCQKLTEQWQFSPKLDQEESADIYDLNQDMVERVIQVEAGMSFEVCEEISIATKESEALDFTSKGILMPLEQSKGFPGPKDYDMVTMFGKSDGIDMQMEGYEMETCELEAVGIDSVVDPGDEAGDVLSNTEEKAVTVVPSPEQNIREIKEIKPKDIAEMCLDITNTGTEVMFADDVDVSEAFRVNGPSKEEVLESETNQVQIRKKEVEQKCHVQADIQEVLALQACVDQLQGWTQLLTELQPQYDTAILNNQAMKHQVSTLQQHNRELDYNNENIVTAKQARVENCKLKSEIFTMVEQAKALEVKEFELTDLQIRYEECICENVRLNECNERLEKRVLSLESKMHIIQEFHDQHATLLDEIGRMRQENAKLIAVVHEMEGQDDEVLSAMQQEDGHATGTADAETFLDLNLQLEAKIQAVSDLEDCCTEFERQNAKLRRALAEMQEKSLQISQKMQAHRSEAGRLAEENLFLRHKISAIKEEDHRETQEAMMLKLENVRKEKITAQKMAESFKRQISELRCRGQELEDENGLLCQKNAENAAAVEEMSAQLGELIRQTDMQATVQHSDRLVACMSALEAEMNKAKEDAATLQQEKAQLTQQLSSLKHQLCDGGHLASAVSREERLEEEKQVLREELARSVEKVAKLGATESQVTQLRQERQAAERQTQGLRSQLSKAQEKFHTLDGTLQVVNLQNSRLKSDLRVAQQEKDALKQEVMSMHQKLQNANDKIQLLEVSLQASGFPSVQRQLLSAELSRLLEQDHQLLAQENSRLLCELQHAKGELLHTREKACQLELSLVTLKQRQQQQGQTGLLKTLEQDKTSLKRELESLRSELHSVQKKTGDQRQFENLTQENKMLKSRLAHLEAQLLEVQLGEMFPPSPVQLPGEHRGCRGDERGPDFSIQDEREVKMLKMEQRMKEVELMLKNVKMLLQEKVTQLKEQVHKNNKADGMIKGLYVENTQLLQALQLSEQRQKTVEKKNFLLEEKISSLNKIVCDLSPSPLPPAPYTFARLDGSALHHP
ncbi:ninein isoform X2 [Denticeps clupeoides]|uniref:ninein isoform X2 n=1 Tax=Denticeps clupeoides TaxID=299321 RepID=UPI0010A53FD6|nr:ninein isoform X2 [Denticeps clupeoides]